MHVFPLGLQRSRDAVLAQAVCTRCIGVWCRCSIWKGVRETTKYLPGSCHPDCVFEHSHIDCLRHNDLFHGYRRHCYRLFDGLSIRLQCCTIFVFQYPVCRSLYKLIELDRIFSFSGRTKQLFLFRGGFLDCQPLPELFIFIFRRCPDLDQ